MTKIRFLMILNSEENIIDAILLIKKKYLMSLSFWAKRNQIRSALFV